MACTDCEEDKNKCDDCTNEGLTINDICNPVECDSDECTESFPAECSIYTGDDIICDGITIVTAGDNMAQAVANITAYFCTRTTIGADVLCNVDTVVTEGTSTVDAITQIVAYFCNAIENISLTPGPAGADGADGVDGVDGVDGINANQVIVEIGPWNMDTTASLSVAHGQVFSNIRGVQVLIADDDGNFKYNLEVAQGAIQGYFEVGNINIDLTRVVSGLFDALSFTGTLATRGWIVIDLA
jgi:hypothetical protein